MDRCDAAQGRLALFDPDADKPWTEKVFRRERDSAGRSIVVWGM